MNVSLVMTIIGADKPGLVEAIATSIAEHQGNWVESRMSHLAGQFAGILRVQVAQPQAEALVTALRELEQQDLQLVIHPDVDEAPPPNRHLVQLELVGNDRPGIVRQVTQAIAAQRINVEELTTECTSAPMSGETLFKASAKLQLPEDGSMERLRQDLERIATDLMVDISLEDA